jgi:acetyl-CoA C-acetyltransferase
MATVATILDVAASHLSKHSFGVYSTEPPPNRFPPRRQSEVDAAPGREVVTTHDGPVTIEAYTVMHGRDGEPEVGLAACLLADGRRTWGRSDDADLLHRFVAEEGCGLTCRVDASGKLRIA